MSQPTAEASSPDASFTDPGSGRTVFVQAKRYTGHPEPASHDLGKARDLLVAETTCGVTFIVEAWNAEADFSRLLLQRMPSHDELEASAKHLRAVTFHLLADLTNEPCPAGAAQFRSWAREWARCLLHQAELGVLDEALSLIADEAAAQPWDGLHASPFSLYRIPLAGPGRPGRLPVVSRVTPGRQIAISVDFDVLPELRNDLIRLFGGILAAASLVRVLVRAALAHRPDTTSLVLVLVAVVRRYGRRGESDDHAVPAHRWTSVISGEPALSC